MISSFIIAKKTCDEFISGKPVGLASYCLNIANHIIIGFLRQLITLLQFCVICITHGYLKGGKTGNTKGLPFEMRQYIKLNYKNKVTRNIYLDSAKRFCDFIKNNGYPSNEVRRNPEDVLQAYSSYMADKGLTADTIHTYLSMPCGFFDITMDKINKPIRSAANISKSRGFGNLQGKKEEEQERYKRLVEFQRRVGIRRAELGRLNNTNFKQDESGWWCVEVDKGKGGKYQLQRIATDDVVFIRGYFNGTGEKFFAPEEMNNKIDLHAMRSAQARRMYEIYLKQCKTACGRESLQQELIHRFCKYNTKYLQSGSSKTILNMFKKELEGNYLLRGKTRQLAREKGRPIAYDKTALMAASVFHLSHWRCGVAVLDYMLA